MEFTKDIEFNKNIQEDEVCKITYYGKLFEIGSKEVTIVFGYGENWENTSEKVMQKTNNGFTTEIKILDNFDTFNFCFRNSNYEWDNNNGCNYISPIQSNLLPIPDENIENVNFSIDNSLVELLNQVFSVNINTSKQESIEKELEDQHKKNSSIIINCNSLKKIKIENINKNYSKVTLYKKNTKQNISTFNLDDLVEELIVPIINSSVKQEKNKTSINYISNSYFDDLYEFNTVTESTFDVEKLIANVNSNSNVDTFQQTTDNTFSSFDFENLLNQITNNSTLENSYKTYENIENTNFDEIMDNFIEENLQNVNDIKNINVTKTNSVIDFSNNSNFSRDDINDYEVVKFFNIINTNFSENNTLNSKEKFEETTSIIEKTNNTDLIITPSKEEQFIVSARKLNKFYLVRKKIKLALYKALVVIPKLLSGEYNSSKN